MPIAEKVFRSQITDQGLAVEDTPDLFQPVLFHRPTNAISFGHFRHPAGDAGGLLINPQFCFAMTLHDRPNHLWDAGEGRLQHDNVQAGDCFIYLPDRPVYVSTDQPFEFATLFLDPFLLHTCAHESLDRDRIEVLALGSLRDSLFGGIMKTLHRGYQQHGKLDRLYVESMTIALCHHTLTNYTTLRPELADLTERGLGKTLLGQVLAYIDDHLNEDLGLEEMAASVHLSPHHFLRLFRQSTGQTLRQYVIEQRVEKAKSLLLQGRLSVGEVAQEVGFYDHAHLIRHFKKTVGVTPKDFRR